MYEMYCTALAENTGRKKSQFWHHRTTLEMQDPKNRQKSPSGHRCTILSGYIFVTKAHIDNRKNSLNSNVSPTCPHNMVNFGLPAAETCWRVWGTPASFNGFRVCAALLHGAVVVGVSHAALNRGRHLYSAGRPSRWALAPISSWYYIVVQLEFFVLLLAYFILITHY